MGILYNQIRYLKNSKFLINNKCCPIIKIDERNFHAYFWLSLGIVGQRPTIDKIKIIF
jgi:hypothetical protein